MPAESPNDAAAGQPSRPTTAFPAQNELASLPSLPAPPDAFAGSAVPVDGWDASTPPAVQDDPAAYDDASAWGDLARSVALARHDRLRLSPALRCAATEVARFYVEQHGLPTESLRRFVVARCGGSTPDSLPVALSLTIPEGTTDAVAFEHTGPQLRQLVEARIASGRWALGLATARRGTRFAAVALLGTDEVTLEATSRVADASHRAIVRGRLRDPAAAAMGLINRGQFGTRVCESDASLAPPAFAVSCELDPGDKAAWAEIVVRREGHVLSHTVADLLLTSGDVAEVQYRPRALGPPALVADAAGLTSALLDAINRTRVQAALRPLALATKQSAHNLRLAGTFIDASFKHREDDADRIALGLVAGWEVDGTIRDGSLFVGMVAPTRDANVWLEFALERPVGRSVLLAPDVSRIAIGPALPPGGASALGAVVTTYALFESPNHEADAAKVLARVQGARAAASRAPLVPIDAGPDLREQSARILRGESEPFAALNVAMRSLVQRSRGVIHGFVVEANDLDVAPIPDAVLHAPAGRVAVSVTHHRVKGAAWGQYVILYLLERDDDGSTPGVKA
ncbi:MAG TPA: hypothetical protein VKU41_18805 [Polyangiaceae bacterium]|nr:hypothetical protein [Polyangiaceae bacterium]